MNLRVYHKEEGIPENLRSQINDFQVERITEFFEDPYTFNIGIVTDEDDIVLGVGVIRVVNEFKMQLNPQLSNLSKARVLKSLLNEAISRRHCGEIIAMITQGGVSYEDMLIKHFNFQKMDGTPLKWEI